MRASNKSKSMKRDSGFGAAALLRAALAASFAALLASAPLAQEAGGSEQGKQSEAPKGDAARPEVGKAIQAARELIQAKKYKEALAKVQETNAVPNLNAYEKFVIDLTRGSAAQGAGET